MVLCSVALRKHPEPSAPLRGCPRHAPRGPLPAPPPQLPPWPTPSGLGHTPTAFHPSATNLLPLPCPNPLPPHPGPVCAHQHHSVVGLPQLWHGHVPAHHHIAVEGTAVRVGRLGKGVDDILPGPRVGGVRGWSSSCATLTPQRPQDGTWVAFTQRAWGPSMRPGSLPSLLTSTEVSTPPSTPRETHLHLRVVGCHAKAHQAKGHELLLEDVHMGPGVVLGEKAVADGAEGEAGPLLVLPFPGQRNTAHLSGLRTQGGLDALQRERPLTPHLPREPEHRNGAAQQQGRLRSDLEDCRPIEMVRAPDKEGRLPPPESYQGSFFIYLGQA